MLGKIEIIRLHRTQVTVLYSKPNFNCRNYLLIKNRSLYGLIVTISLLSLGCQRNAYTPNTIEGVAFKTMDTTLVSKATAVPPPNQIAYYEADVISHSDYYPYGMEMSERSEGEYRFGYNGKEADDEVAADRNSLDYGFRIYNPRLGRFLSVDPLMMTFPWLTPYQFAGDKPVIAIDLDGLEEYVIVNYRANGRLVGWGIKYLEMPTASTVELQKLENELAGARQARAQQESLRGYRKKKDINKAIAEIDVAIPKIEAAILEEKNKIQEENERLFEANKGKAVTLDIEVQEQDLTSVDQVAGAIASISQEDISGEPINDLDEGIRELLQNTNNNAKVSTFNNRRTAGTIYAQYVPQSFSGNSMFSVGTFELSNGGKTSLSPIIQTLISNPNMQVDIFGHTDNSPGMDNMKLSQNRANAVKKYLISQGVKAEQIREVKGFGDTRPVSTNDTEEGRAENRRVEIKQVK